ncbi:MAG: nucleotidyltransferase family protein [Chloroflexota bacterium]
MSDNVQNRPTIDMLRSQRDEIIEIATARRAYDVRVFGSVARGEATSASDVDIIVSFHEGASLFDLSGLRLDLEALLGCKVDLLSDHPGMRDRLRQRVMQDVIAL